MPLMTTEQRRTFIMLAQRRQRAGAGSHRDFLLRRTTNVQWLDLTPVLSPIGWAVVGAVATRHYMPERMTQDLDIAIAVGDSAEARRKLKEAGFVYQGERRTLRVRCIGGSSWTAPDGTSVDVVEGTDEWWANAIAEAQSNRDAQGLPILPLRYLVLMKFRAGRVQDLADVTRMLGQADNETLASVRRLFARYAPDDREDLESLIALGKLEMQS